MKRYKPLILVLSGVAGLIFSGRALAETPFVDPHIPDGEKAVYASQVGDTKFTVENTVAVKKDGNREIYEITSLSKRQDKVIRLDKKTMAIISVHAVRKYTDATLDSILNVVSEKQTYKDNEIKLADFNILMYLMRGFPFGKLQSLKVGYYGEGNEKSYTMVMNFKGTEKVTLKDKAYDCYKLDFGMSSFLGTFLPKLNLWYSVAPPHYLVRYEGPEGPPGTPRRIMELVSYESRKSAK
ncbi:MAG: hypothetical protein NTZ51_09070 [Proteobacteria bacterium]|nr:hypothetical protein [Pseudomonadota bacterium]